MIRVTRKRLIVTTTILLLLVGALVVTWEACDWPPPRLILKYGFPPAGGPTGRRMSVGGIDFVEISAGYFRAGSHYGCSHGDVIGRLCSSIGLDLGSSPEHQLIECPLRWTEIPSAFWIGTTEVTYAQYSSVFLDKEPVSEQHEPECPVEEVSWLDAIRFCSEFIRDHSVGARLPTIEEWEYACRAGSTEEFGFRGGADRLAEYAWYAQDTEPTGPASVRDGAQPVRTRKPNAWGLYDMHGNVMEWCERRITARDRRSKHATLCPRKGGSWRTPFEFCRSAYCGWSFADLESEGMGFRLVLLSPEETLSPSSAASTVAAPD